MNLEHAIELLHRFEQACGSSVWTWNGEDLHEALRVVIDAAHASRVLPQSIQEALNSGDGSYRP